MVKSSMTKIPITFMNAFYGHFIDTREPTTLHFITSHFRILENLVKYLALRSDSFFNKPFTTHYNDSDIVQVYNRRANQLNKMNNDNLRHYTTHRMFHNIKPGRIVFCMIIMKSMYSSAYQKTQRNSQSVPENSTFS